jgi:hypothetical protein
LGKLKATYFKNMLDAFTASWLLYIHVLELKARFNQIFWTFKGFFSVPNGEGPDNLGQNR